MFPLKDIIPSRTTPWVTYAIIVINVLVFGSELTMGDAAIRRFVFDYGLVPVRFSWASAVTSTFVHGGWLHIIGNMWSLWIFGDNVEDRMGHGRFLTFYLLTG